MTGDVNVQDCKKLLCPVKEHRGSYVERFLIVLAWFSGKVNLFGRRNRSFDNKVVLRWQKKKNG